APVAMHTDRLSTSGGVLRLSGTLDIRSHQPIRSAQLAVTGRDNDVDIHVPVSLSHDHPGTVVHFGRHRYRFDAELALSELIGSPLPPHAIADVWLHTVQAPCDEQARVRVGNVPYSERLAAVETSATSGNEAVRVIPY